jgi:DNA-binding response OmpR family regulator
VWIGGTGALDGEEVNLNGESGLDVLDFIKGRDPNVPVLMFTGLDVNEDLAQKTLRGRAEAIMHKTQSLEGLLTSVRFHLAKASAR